MFCSKCGKQVDPSSRFCPAYKATISAPPPPPPGVYPNPNNLVRIITALVALFTGIGAVAYLVLWVIIPEEPYALPAKGI